MFDFGIFSLLCYGFEKITDTNPLFLHLCSILERPKVIRKSFFYRYLQKSGREDSNLRPPAPKAPFSD